MIGQTMSEKKITDGKFPDWISGRRTDLVFQRFLRSIPAIAEFLIHRITLDICFFLSEWKFLKAHKNRSLCTNCHVGLEEEIHFSVYLESPDQLLFFGHKARAKLEAMTSLVKEISKRFLFYTLYLCTFKAEILFVRLFSIPRILLLIVRNGMFLTTKINSIPFEFFWWIFRWYVAEAGDARSKQDILIRIVWPPHIRLEFFMKSYLIFQ